jgi:hypothetical protein
MTPTTKSYEPLPNFCFVWDHIKFRLMIILPSNVKFYWFRNLFLFPFPFFLLRWDLYQNVEIIYMTWIFGLLLIESHSFLDFWKKCLEGGGEGKLGRVMFSCQAPLFIKWFFCVPLICACEASPHSRTNFADFNFPNCPTSWWSSKSCALELKSQQDTLQEINLFLFASDKLWVSTCFCTCICFNMWIHNSHADPHMLKHVFLHNLYCTSFYWVPFLPNYFKLLIW